MKIQAQLRLWFALFLCGFLAPAIFFSPAAFAYDGHSQTNVYDSSGESSVGYDDASALVRGEEKNGATGNRVCFAKFTEFLAAKAAPRVPAAGGDLYVGLYGESRAANIQSGLNATHTPHHVVQDAVSGTSRYSGVTINLDKDLHALTRTYGRNADLGSNVRNLAADVRDLRNILRGAGYDRPLVNQQMQRLIELNRQVGNVPP